MKKQYLLIILFIFTLSSCGIEDNKVSVFIYDENDPYVYEFSQQILEKSNGQYDITYSQNSQIIQNQDIVKAIDSNTDLMIINPVDRLSAYVMIEKLKIEEIPVIFFNREPLEKDLDLYNSAYYIGAPAEQPGIFQAEMIMELFGNNARDLNSHDLNNDDIIQVAILKGEQGHQDAEARTKSVIDEFQKQGFEVELLTIESANWNKEKASLSMQKIIDEYPQQFEVVISNNDAMAIGAIETLIANDYFIDDNNDGLINGDDTSWIPVIGVDGLTPALDYIESGHMYGTVIQDSDAMADAMIDLVDTILYNKDMNQLLYPLIDDTYIWINYQKYTNE